MWIVKPSTCSPCVPATGDSTSDLTSQQAERLAWSVTLSGKLLRPQSWRLAWKRKPWLMRLSGVISEPSTVDLGVESWIASLAATRVNRSASPVSVLANVMNAIYGRTSLESLAILNPASCSSRTSPDTSLSASMLFAPILSASASEYRLDYSRRRRLAQAIVESAYSSSAWPTPNCPAPHDNEDTATRDCGKNQHDLVRAATLWPTTRMTDCKNSRASNNGTFFDRTLLDAVIQWPTPRTITGGAESTTRKKELGRMESGGGDLQAMTQEWPTPARMETGGEDLRSTWTPGKKPVREDGKNLQTALTTCAQIWGRDHSPQDQASSTNGGKSSPPDPTSRPRLNPMFAEWLMGLPHGWTDFAPLETEWFLYRRLMRSSLSGLVSRMKEPR